MRPDLVTAAIGKILYYCYIQMMSILQVHALFRAKFSTVFGEQRSKSLMFVRQYTSGPWEEAVQELDLSLRHLVLEEILVKHGKASSKQPHHAVRKCSSVLQQACICPRFQHWDEKTQLSSQ